MRLDEMMDYIGGGSVERVGADSTLRLFSIRNDEGEIIGHLNVHKLYGNVVKYEPDDEATWGEIKPIQDALKREQAEAR